MEVHLIGTGTAVPDPKHTQACTLVSSEGGSGRLAVDLGGGAINRIPEWESVGHFLFSHDHPDHVGGLDQLLQSHLFGRVGTAPDAVPPRLTLYGPPSVRELVEEIRARHFAGRHSEERLSGSLVWKSLMDGVSITTIPGFRVECFATGHTRDSLGFRIESGGRTAAVTSDASASGRLAELVERSDAAVMECSLPPGIRMPGHLNAEEIAELVSSLGERAPGRIVLTHLYPPALEAAEAIRGLFPARVRDRIQFGQDGEVVPV